MRRITAAAGLALLAILAAVGDAAAQRGSHGQTPGVIEPTGLAALSHDEVEGLLAGKGMGFAKPAEANGYPGPLHIMELDAKLELTSEQRRAVQAIFVRMQSKASELGHAYVQAETKLEAAFRGGTATAEAIRPLVAETERLRAELRLVHLNAHLEVTPFLTPRQLIAYQELRGDAAKPVPAQAPKPRGSH